MAKRKHKQTQELDGVFVLKLVLYVLFGSMWVKIHSSDLSSGVPIPAGLIVGLLFASHDHFKIDRKIEYAALIMAALIGLIAPYGIFIST